MSRHFKFGFLPKLILTVVGLAANLASAQDGETLAVSKACRSSESWNLGATLRKDFQEEFREFLSHKTSPARGFAEALALRQWAPSLEAKRLAEYWLARSFFSANFIHLAKLSFENVALDDTVLPVRLAAIDCLNAIHEKHPAISSTQLDAGVLSKIFALVTTSAEKEVLHKYAFHLFLAAPQKENLALLKGAGPLEKFAFGLWNAKQGHHEVALQNFEALLDKTGNSVTTPLVDINVLNSLLGRSYYSTQKFEKSVQAFKRIQKNSNQLSESLSELSWSQLMAGQYREAIGTGQSLQVGGLKRTFAPEALMVMAMALNELCQYPGSFEAIKIFKKSYESSFFWLQKWHEEKEKPSLYGLAVDYIRKKADVPDRIASEWIRSPLFLETQGEMNLISDEKDAFENFPQAALREYQAMGQDILTFGRSIKERLQNAKAVRAGRRLASLDELPHPLLRDIAKFRAKVTHYKRFAQAALPWKKIAAKNLGHISALKRNLASTIETDLRNRTETMRLQLLEIAENNQLIEVEIYSEASKDIIWQNAHPDYKEVAQKLKDERNEISHQTQLNWGTMNAGEDAEVWEDELGSVFANVFDNCSSKDRYLAVKRK